MINSMWGLQSHLFNNIQLIPIDCAVSVLIQSHRSAQSDYTMKIFFKFINLRFEFTCMKLLLYGRLGTRVSKLY